MRAAPAILLLLAATAAPAAGGIVEDADPKSLDDCDALVRRHPGQPEAYRCYLVVGTRLGRQAEAARRLQARLQIDPGDHWARFRLAQLMRSLGRRDAARELLEAAADGFAAAGVIDGEVWSREHLSHVLFLLGRASEGRAHLDRALELARSAGDPLLVASTQIELGWWDRREGDYRSAWKRFKEAESALFPGGGLNDRIRVLAGLGALAFDIGRFADSWRYYERQLELVGDLDPGRRAVILKNMTIVASRFVQDGTMRKEELRALLRDAVDTAIRGGNHHAEVSARIMLAEDLDGPEGLEEARRAAALARETGDVDLCWALWVLAESTQQADPSRHEEAMALVDEAIEITRRRGDRRRTARGLLVRAGLIRKTDQHRRAVAEELAALDAVERIRDLQADREVRSRVFAAFANSYRRIAAWLLTRPGGLAPREALEAGFAVIERLRSRELLDTLDAGRGSGAHGPDGPGAEQRSTVLRQVAEVQRQLMDPGLAAPRREALLEQLEGLELREAELREEIARQDPEFAALRRPQMPALAEVQDALAPDQALVEFVGTTSTSPGGARGYRALSITASRVEVVELELVPPEIELFRALLARRDGAAVDGAARLGAELMGGILSGLPPEVGRLVLIPDGALHRVPFGALISPQSGEPLAARYEISLAPSAATWLRWRQGAPGSPELDVLALADPALAFPGGTGTLRQAGVFGEAQRLGALPHARHEAQVMLRRLGGAGRVLTGEGASEHAFKTADPARFAVLHLAAHALVDDANPERSAVVLAPGSADEDGLLQFREILDLALDGQVVVLSACRGAAGRVVGGEGVMGLANAFFQAGARTVVASLWPLRDQEAAEMVEELATSLGRGESVGSALGAARRTLIRRGAPAAAWAGLVVLGDADFVPLPGGRSVRRAWAPWVLGAGLLVVFAGGLLLLRRAGAPVPGRA